MVELYSMNLDLVYLEEMDLYTDEQMLAEFKGQVDAETIQKFKDALKEKELLIGDRFTSFHVTVLDDVIMVNKNKSIDESIEEVIKHYSVSLTENIIYEKLKTFPV